MDYEKPTLLRKKRAENTIVKITFYVSLHFDMHKIVAGIDQKKIAGSEQLLVTGSRTVCVLSSRLLLALDE